MKVSSLDYITIWLKKDDPRVVEIIDQRALPHHFVIEELRSCHDVVTAIKDMHVRGAPLIGVSAAYGVYLAALEAQGKSGFEKDLAFAFKTLNASRPTARNLFWALERASKALEKGENQDEKVKIALSCAQGMAQEEIERCRKIGEHGLTLIEEIRTKKKGKTVNILTHCNAGWLACIDYGTATAPIYLAAKKGYDLHVWVDETRPRNQGASLTAWELLENGIPHTVIADNTGGHLMQHGMVDLVITGADRVSRCGDAANKIGTYLKALAAFDNNVPFYIAVPESTFDFSIRDGVSDIPIEERSPDELRYIEGLSSDGLKKVLIMPEQSPVLNYAFDVTPARLITGLITERGICNANEESILKEFPEYMRS